MGQNMGKGKDDADDAGSVFNEHEIKLITKQQQKKTER